MNGNKFQDLYAEVEPGIVVAILNPEFIKSHERKGFALKVDECTQIAVLGTAEHFGFCSAELENGKKCKQVINMYEIPLSKTILNT